jgi:transcription elongation factor Elf1
VAGRRTHGYLFEWAGCRRAASVAFGRGGGTGGRAKQQQRVQQVVAAFQKKLPVVTCPGCNKPMQPGKPKAVTRSVARELADITYVCANCGTRTERTIKDD